jgi:hypothetical protein
MWNDYYFGLRGSSNRVSVSAKSKRDALVAFAKYHNIPANSGYIICYRKNPGQIAHSIVVSGNGYCLP